MRITFTDNNLLTDDVLNKTYQEKLKAYDGTSSAQAAGKNSGSLEQAAVEGDAGFFVAQALADRTSSHRHEQEVGLEALPALEVDVHDVALLAGAGEAHPGARRDAARRCVSPRVRQRVRRRACDLPCPLRRRGQRGRKRALL